MQGPSSAKSMDLRKNNQIRILKNQSISQVRMGRKMTSFSNMMLPQQKEADPRELLIVHILLPSQEAPPGYFRTQVDFLPVWPVFSPDPKAREVKTGTKEF